MIEIRIELSGDEVNVLWRLVVASGGLQQLTYLSAAEDEIEDGFDDEDDPP